MAANSKSAQGIARLGKRLIKQICSPNSITSSSTTSPAPAAFTLFRRGAHSSVYDKNFDDQVRPEVVPDDLIQLESEKYWAPHPQTGVFGPATEHNSETGEGSGFSSSTANGGQDSLEEKAWFRPTSLEDLEKPHHI